MVLLIGLLPGAARAELGVASEEQTSWRYGAYIDLSYPANFNTSEPHPWRSKLTTSRLSEFSPNMGMFYLKKEVSETSRWGFELGGQAGYDTDGLLPADSRLPGADVLRYFSHANIRYLAPVGAGLSLTAGLYPSFIGYESFYAKDNPNYTRSWIADYSPYFLIGLGGRYPVREDVDLGLYLLSDYDYLAHRNNHPKYGAQVAWRLRPRFQLTQNLFLGPEQQNTALRYWRFFSDTILQWTGDDYSVGLAYDIGTEQSADTARAVRSVWTGAALFTRWRVSGPWAVGLRPELYWDPNGTLTGSEQFIKAVTATLEYTLNEGLLNSRLRLEYRYDNSTGKQGGFYGGKGVDGPLVSGQSTIFFAVLTSFDR